MYLDIKVLRVMTYSFHKLFMKPEILKQCTGFCAWLRITNVSCKTKVLSNNYVLFHRVSTRQIELRKAENKHVANCCNSLLTLFI